MPADDQPPATPQPPSGGSARSTVTYMTAAILLRVAHEAAYSHTYGQDAGLVEVVFGAFAIEATINELLWGARRYGKDHSGGLRVLAESIDVLELDQPTERVSTRRKIALAASTLRNESGVFGRAPLQGADLLFQLRDYLAHHKPETQPSISDDLKGVFAQHKMTERLCRAVNIDAPPADIASPFISLIMRPEVAPRLYPVVHAALKEILSWFPDAVSHPITLALNAYQCQ